MKIVQPWFTTCHVCNWILLFGRMYLPSSSTRLNLKRNIFFSSRTCCLTKDEEPNLPYHLPIDIGIIAQFKIICKEYQHDVKCKQSHWRVDHESQSKFPMKITVKLQTALFVWKLGKTFSQVRNNFRNICWPLGQKWTNIIQYSTF